MQRSYKNMVAITPHDVTLLTSFVAEIIVAVGGTVTVVTINDQVVQFTAVAGHRYPIIVKRVNATGTAATGIVGLY